MLPRPSDAVTRIADETTSSPPATIVADARGTTPGRLKRLLRGNLDRIVGMAVRKEPACRCASAAAFADGLDRYLQGAPVLARGDSVAIAPASSCAADGRRWRRPRSSPRCWSPECSARAPGTERSARELAALYRAMVQSDKAEELERTLKP